MKRFTCFEICRK